MADMADWIFARDSARHPDRQAELKMTPAERREWTDDIVAILPFCETEPEVSWLGLSGSCLLVAPRDPKASIRGLSQKVLVFGIQSRGALGIVEIPRPGDRLRTSGSGRIWVTHPDTFNAEVLEGFELPYQECRGRRFP